MPFSKKGVASKGNEEMTESLLSPDIFLLPCLLYLYFYTRSVCVLFTQTLNESFTLKE